MEKEDSSVVQGTLSACLKFGDIKFEDLEFGDALQRPRDKISFQYLHFQ